MRSDTITALFCLINVWANWCTIGQCNQDTIVNTDEISSVQQNHVDGHTPQVTMKNGDRFFLPKESMESISKKMKCGK